MTTDYPPRSRRVVVLAAAIAGAALTARLGVWQLDRAAQKEALQAALDSRSSAPVLEPAQLAQDAAAAEAQHYRRVRVRGRWLAERTLFLENRPMDGQAGFIVVTPLQLEGDGGAVLVQRGWAPRDQADRRHVPTLPSVATPVDVDGLIAPPPGHLVALGAESVGAIRQNLDVAAFARETGLRLRPFTVQQDDTSGAADDGLRRHWPRPALDVHKHYGYAFQWFAMAALITGLYVWFQLVRPRLRRAA